jgi:ABC-type antimicrobial peptide transport system permease subunit
MYGVLSYSVSQRAREFGVRLALGARERDVVAMVTGQAIRLALAGVVAGLALSVLLGRLVASLLYGVTPRDPATLAGAVLLAAAIGLAGAYVPARRAARVDPEVSLRFE